MTATDEIGRPRVCGAARRLFCEIVLDHPPLHRGELGEVGFFVEDDGIHAEELCAAAYAVFDGGDAAPDHGVAFLFDVDVERVTQGLAAVAAGEEDVAVVLPLMVQHVIENGGLERAEMLVVRPRPDLLDEIFAIEQDVGDGYRAREVIVVFVVGECSGLECELGHADASLCDENFWNEASIADIRRPKVNTVLTFGWKPEIL